MSDVEFYPEQRVFIRPTAVDTPKPAEVRASPSSASPIVPTPSDATAAPFARLRPSSHTVTSDLDAPLVPPHSSLPPPPPQIISASGDGMYTVKVNGKPRTSVPSAHLARRFDDGERVLYNPDGKIETSRKDKTRPKGIVAVVTHVDASLWPPTYMITEVGKTGHRETEGGRLVAESLARGVRFRRRRRRPSARRTRRSRTTREGGGGGGQGGEGGGEKAREGDGVHGGRGGGGSARDVVQSAGRPPGFDSTAVFEASSPARVRERFRDGGREGKLG